MKIRTSSFLCTVLLVLAVTPAIAARLPGDLLGVSIGMSYDDSRERLEKVGQLAGGPLGASGGKQIWKLDDRRYSHVVVRYNSEHRVEWITAFAKVEGAAVRYRDIGDLKKARLQGRYFYTWNQPASKKRPASLVRACGTDPERLASLSLYRLGSAFREVQDVSGRR
jgi:hypothetical protein